MRARWQWITFFISIALGLVLWRWKYPQTPALYELRVQVVDAAQTPVRGSVLHASAGNEPHLLPDGWWEVQIPHAKVPANGEVTVWAEHPDWDPARAAIRLGSDAQPKLELRLRAPHRTLSGMVVDDRNRAVGGVRVNILDHPLAPLDTDHDGRFSVVIPAADGAKVALHVEHPSYRAQDAFCSLGVPCTIYLQAR